ncbi:MAG: hypothetical protein OXG27_15990 [Chloroflexi bacterium]|nr:hypothetical protein [Chloroflexota bacterium]
MILLVLALPAQVLAHPPTEPTLDELESLNNAIVVVEWSWPEYGKRSFKPLETRSHSLPISPDEAAAFLLDLDHAIDMLDRLAAAAKEQTVSHVPWFRTIQFDAEEASYWYQRTHREVQAIIATRYGFQFRVGQLRQVAREANLSAARLFATLRGYSECYLDSGWFRLPDGTCWRGSPVATD